MSNVRHIANHAAKASTTVEGINPEVKPSGTGCVECLAGDHPEGAWWLHLRRCAECGHIGCCDSSPNTHATKHFHKTKHPVIQSFEHEDGGWFYSYVSEDQLDDFSPTLLAAPRWHPDNQSVPFYLKG